MSQKKIIIKCINLVSSEKNTHELHIGQAASSENRCHDSKPINHALQSIPTEVAWRLACSASEPIVLIDSSYFSFYRSHATRSWYIRAHPADDHTDWISNPVFMEMYESKFREHVEKIAKVLRVPIQSLIFVRDCHREEIWRTQLFPAYKAHRNECEIQTNESGLQTNKNKSNMGPVIKYSNDNILSPDASDRLPVRMIRVPGAEADDIIAVLTSYHNTTEPDREVWIVANDTDFHQLLGSPHNKIFKIGQKYTLVPAIPTSSSVEIKVLCGDKTDGIPPIFPGCGPVTAAGLVNNPANLAAIFAKNPQAQVQYALNRKLIDFREIPKEISEKIIQLFLNGCTNT